MKIPVMCRSGLRLALLVCPLLIAGSGCGHKETPPPEIEIVKMDSKPDFWSGSNSFPPLKKESIEAFLISRSEITQAQYEAVMGENPSVGDHGPALPVQNVTWMKAATFCNKLSKRLGLQPCYDESKGFACDRRKSGFRLPYSHEWEYACRGDATTPYFWGPDRNDQFCVPPLTPEELKKVTSKINHSFAKPVKSKRPNPFGLYDMVGNVSEWCQDVVQDNADWRVYRGGSWEDHNWEAFQSKWSSGMPRDQRLPTVGFRVVRKPTVENSR